MGAPFPRGRHLLPLEDLTAAPTPYYVKRPGRPDDPDPPGETQRWRIGNISADFSSTCPRRPHAARDHGGRRSEGSAAAPERDRAGTGQAAEVLVQAGTWARTSSRRCPSVGPEGEADGGAGDDGGRGEPIDADPAADELVPFLDLRPCRSTDA